MSKVVYLAYYDESKKRNITLCGNNLTKYVIETLKKTGKEIVVISPAISIDGKVLDREETIIDGVRFIYRKSLKSRKNIIYRIINKIRYNFSLNKEIKNNVDDGDTVIVYHSLGLISCTKRIKKKKNINLIIQVAEVYSDAYTNKKEKEKGRKKELDFFKCADKYIFSSNLLEKSINSKNKPNAICLGAYSKTKNMNSIFKDEKIHIVYSGTVEKRKGAMMAVACGEFLTKDYAIHILGHGSRKEMNKAYEDFELLKDKVKCDVSFESAKIGDEYSQFLQSCLIALSPQDPEAEYNPTSFPSKIPCYMANGLRVVSVRIPAIEQSDVGEYLYYFDEYTPNALASKIMSIDLNDAYDSRKIIENLDNEFLKKLSKLIG